MADKNDRFAINKMALFNDLMSGKKPQNEVPKSSGNGRTEINDPKSDGAKPSNSARSLAEDFVKSSDIEVLLRHTLLMHAIVREEWPKGNAKFVAGPCKDVVMQWMSAALVKEGKESVSDIVQTIFDDFALPPNTVAKSRNIMQEIVKCVRQDLEDEGKDVSAIENMSLTDIEALYRKHAPGVIQGHEPKGQSNSEVPVRKEVLDRLSIETLQKAFMVGMILRGHVARSGSSYFPDGDFVGLQADYINKLCGEKFDMTLARIYIEFAKNKQYFDFGALVTADSQYVTALDKLGVAIHTKMMGQYGGDKEALNAFVKQIDRESLLRLFAEENQQLNDDGFSYRRSLAL